MRITSRNLDELDIFDGETIARASTEWDREEPNRHFIALEFLTGVTLELEPNGDGPDPYWRAFLPDDHYTEIDNTRPLELRRRLSGQRIISLRERGDDYLVLRLANGLILALEVEADHGGFWLAHEIVPTPTTV